MFPSVFLSHGSPMLPLTESPARDFLAELGQRLGRPRAILVASAHWDTPVAAVNATERNETIHDFHGFPPALFALRYPAPGAPGLAERASDLLCEAGIASKVDRARGLDHGAWVPLSLMYPAADVPVFQVSVQSRLGPAHHFQLGRVLAPLRERDDVLVIGSGSFTHNLSRLRPGGEEPADTTAFADWMDSAIRDRRCCDLLTYRTLAPGAVANHPTEEHLFPLFVAMGVAGREAQAERLHSGGMYGALRMDAYAFA